MSLNELIENYSNGSISKEEYASKVFSKYEELYGYSKLLATSDTERIIINKKDILFDISLSDINGQQYSLYMKLWGDDIAQVPATITTFGSYEKEELKMVSLLFEYLPFDAVVFDVGANYGWYSLNIKKMYPKTNIYAFEPIVETYNKMLINFKINELDINAYNIGFYNDSADMDFYYDTTASGASSMCDLRGLDTTVIERCHMLRMDEFFHDNRIKGIDFVKCDVEGSELFVYQGGIESIKKYSPIVFSEMLRKWSAKFGYHPNDIIRLFDDLGYGCYVMERDCRLRELKMVTDETIETNYFFLHRTKHNRIIEELVKQ